MAGLTDQELISKWGGLATPTTIPEPPSDEPINPTTGLEGPYQEPISLAPATQAEVNKAGSGMELSRLARPIRSAPNSMDLRVQLGARPGVPFDSNSGIPWISRLASEREPTKEEQLGALYKEYGKENVRLNQFGTPIVTTTDEKGKTVDVLANPLGLDWGDTATLAASTPELAGSIVPLLLTRGATLGPGVLKALGTLALTTGGAELGGAAKDMFRRWVEGRDVNPEEVGIRHAQSGATGLMVGAGLGAGGYVFGRAISPFSNPGRLNFMAKDAQDFFDEKYGIKIPMTAAETTGSPILQAGEAMESQQPGSRTAFGKFRQKQQETIDQLRKIATGNISDEEEMGQRVVSNLKQEISPIEFDVQEAAQRAEQQAANAIKGVIGSPVDKNVIGKSIDLGAKLRKSGFDMVNDSNYGAFYGNPLSTEKIIGGSPLKQAVDNLIEDLPSIEKSITKPVLNSSGQPIVDASGNPITRTELANVPVSTPVRSQLEEISSKLANGKLSINDLKSIRTDVDNAIKTGEAVPGVREGRLKQYYSALTDAIDKGLNDIGDAQLSSSWKTATDYYKKNVGKFEKAGIADIFRDPINAIGPTELTQRATRDPDIYAAYKEFFGPNSPQIKGVQQAAKDDVLNLGNLGKTVNARDFARRLEELDSRSPELLKDAFGSSAEKLRNEALIMMRSQGQEIPKEELDRAISSGTLSADSLRDMITAESRRTTAFNNSLVKDLSRGTLGPDKIKPTQVVDKFVLNPSTQPEELSQLMDIASKNPQTLEDMRRLTFKKVLDDSTVTAKNGNRTISALDLDNILSNPSLSKKLQIALGPDSYEDLSRLRDFLKPGQVSQEAFKAAGGLVAGTQINRVLAHGDLSALPAFVKNFVLATVYTSEPIKNLLSNTVLQQEGKALAVNTAIASEPFLRALTTTYTKEKAKEVQATIKGYVDQMAYRDPSSARPGPTPGAQGINWDRLIGGQSQGGQSGISDEDLIRKFQNAPNQ